MPIVTTLHTVLSRPTSAQYGVLDQIIAASSKVIVMAEKGSELLRSVYGAPSEKTEIIPHGLPTPHSSNLTRRRPPSASPDDRSS